MNGCVCMCVCGTAKTQPKARRKRESLVFFRELVKEEKQPEGRRVMSNVMCESNLCVRDWGGRGGGGGGHHWAAKSRMSLSPSHKRWTSALKLSLMPARTQPPRVKLHPRRCVCASLLWRCVCTLCVWICRVSPDRPCQTLLESGRFFYFFF